MRIFRFNESDLSHKDSRDNVLKAIQLFQCSIVELLDERYYYYFKFDSNNNKRVVIDIGYKNEQIFTYDDLEFLSKNLDTAYEMHDKKGDVEIKYITFYLVSKIKVPEFFKGRDHDFFYKNSFTLEQIKDKIEVVNKFDNIITELDKDIKYYISRIPYNLENILYNHKTPPEGGLISTVMVEIKIKL